MRENLLLNCALMLSAVTILTCCNPAEENLHYVKPSMISCSFKATNPVPVRINIASNPTEWSVESFPEWIEITEQTADAMVLLPKNNPLDIQRKGEIVIKAGEAVAEIKVVQLIETSLQSGYFTVGDYVMGAAISPNGLYAGGYWSAFDEVSKVYIKHVVITDLREGKDYLIDPFPSTLYSIYAPCAITDSGDLTFRCEDNRMVTFSINGDITVLRDVPGAGMPWMEQVADDESGVWVGFGFGGETLYTPVKWTDGIAEILSMPETTYRGGKWRQGAQARGCSLDGQIIYGTAWEGHDSGLMWWDKDGNVRWVGDKVRKLKPVKVFDEVTQTYVDDTFVDGIVGTSNNFAISPSGQWIAGSYRTEELNATETDKEVNECPAFYDTFNDEVYILYDYKGAAGLTATDDGIGVIGNGAESGITSSTDLVDIVTGAHISSTTDWVRENLGIIIPSDSILEYISPDHKVAFGYDLRGTGGEAMRKWYVVPYKTQE